MGSECAFRQCIPLSGDQKNFIPILGLGTWQAQPQEIEDVILNALEIGYRHIDTAFNYNNEEAIGQAISKWIGSGKGTRKDLFITTKLPHVGNRAKDAEKFLKLSLERLQTDYIDLYLIHMPFAFVCDEKTLTPLLDNKGHPQLDLTNDNCETWKVLEQIVKKDLVKSIGLSNFNAEQIRNVYNCAEIKPAVLQVELHAYFQQKELRALCKELHIAVTSYSSLGSPGAQQHFAKKYNYSIENYPDILGHPVVQKIAAKHKKTCAQILLRHLIQQNVVVIPKSSNANRLKENADIFDFQLAKEELDSLNGLDKGEDGRIFNFLFFHGVEKHPQYPFRKES